MQSIAYCAFGYVLWYCFGTSYWKFLKMDALRKIMWKL